MRCVHHSGASAGLANVVTGDYSLILLRHFGQYTTAWPLGAFPGKTPEISGTPLFDETIDGSNYTNIFLWNGLQVPSAITITLQNINVPLKIAIGF